MSEYFPEQYEVWLKVLQEISGKRVAVIGHIRPDGDCIGSQVALVRALRSRGVDAFAVNHHPVPRNCQAFVGDTPFYRDDEPGFDWGDECIAITVDCADRTRIGPVAQERFKEVLANIDHHISNRRYATYNLVEPASSATGELLAGLFFDSQEQIDPVTAQALYIGIATDTGQFRYSSTTRTTFTLCCLLLDHGADPTAAALQLYESEDPAKLALLQRFLQSLRYLHGGKVCVGILKNVDFEQTGAQREFTEGLVDYARCVDGVEIGILLEETPTGLKGSFRAKDAVHRVDQLAQQFNGGGHSCAAGFNPDSTLDEFYPRLVEALEQHFKQFDE
jgi:bifunctional oligoribonuclease and PAP phosphatase NrnA